MATTAGQFAEAVAEEIPNFFRDTFDQLADGEGEYLRSGNPRSGTAKVGQAVGRAYCRLYGQNPDSVLGGVGPRVEKACRPYLADLGFSQGPKVGVPFFGGQCDGTTYRVRGTYIGSCGANTGVSRDWQAADLVGPISGIGLDNQGNGWVVKGKVAQSNCVPVGFPFGIVNVPRPGTGCAQLPSDIYAATQTPVITSIQAISGPDTCGSQPPVVTPPPPITNPQPPPFRFNPDGDINIDVDVDINPDGSVTFDVGTGPITIDPFGGDGGGGGGNPPPPPGDVGDPGPSEDTGVGGEAEGEAPPGSILVGLKLDILATPPRAREFAAGIFRGACYIYMGTPAGLDHDPAGSMLQDGQFVFAEKENLTSWRVNANVGYNIRTTPYYREAEG